MPTFGDMIDEVVATMAGQTSDVPMMGTLVSAIGATDTTLHFDFGQQPGAARPNGLVEIDRELILINQFDPTTGTAVVPGWGRGQRGSGAAAHAAGAQVTVRPRYPRSVVARTINEIVQGTSPDLYGATDLDPIVISGVPQIAYPLPANTLRVLRIETQIQAGWPYREIIRNFTVNTKASGMELELHHRIFQAYLNQTLTVTVATAPAPMVADTDDYVATTTLPASTADVMTLGTLARLAMSAESARLQVSTVEALGRDDKIQLGSGTSLAKTWMAMYTQRLQSEVKALQQRYPIQLLRRE
jgi:hypothetical protein